MKRWRGAYGGYRVWRNGSPRPARQTERIYTGASREHMVGAVMDALQDWRLSPFEFEAPCRHSLRSALIMKGHSWAKADAEAESLVDEALRLLGVRRPTWEEGQREYVVPRENCNWCAGPLDSEQISRKARLCSVECARAAVIYRDYETRIWDSAIGLATYRMVMRDALPSRQCAYCGRDFKPPRTLSRQRFCSIKCADLAKEKEPERRCANPRCRRTFRRSTTGNQFYCSAACRQRCGHVATYDLTCHWCGSSFTGKRRDAKFCGSRCRDTFYTAQDQMAAGRALRRQGDTVLGECRFCGSSFAALSLRALYCSVDCRTLAQALRTGSRIPKTITRPLFDHLLTRHYRHARRRVLSPPIFDRLFRGGLRTWAGLAAQVS